jgi:hypothetical protein
VSWPRGHALALSCRRHNLAPILVPSTHARARAHTHAQPHIPTLRLSVNPMPPTSLPSTGVPVSLKPRSPLSPSAPPPTSGMAGQVFYDRALQTSELPQNDLLASLMYRGQLGEVMYLEQQRGGLVTLGSFLADAPEAELWYVHLEAAAEGTDLHKGSQVRQREFKHLAAPYARRCL